MLCPRLPSFLAKSLALLVCLNIASCGGNSRDAGTGGAPVNIVVGPTQTGLMVSWNAPLALGSDGNTLVITSFNVYRGNSAVTLLAFGTVAVNNIPPIASETTFTDNTVTSGNTFFYAITAVDVLGNESPQSGVIGAVAP